MNVLDQLDQRLRIEGNTGLGAVPNITIPRTHLRALLDVTRAAHEYANGSWTSTDKSYEALAALAAALTPLLEETQ